MRNILEVAITGRGMVTSLGTSYGATMAAILAGNRVHGEKIPSLKDSPYENYLAAPELSLHEMIAQPARRMRKFMSKHSELAAVAAHEAIAEAGLAARNISPERIGLYAGVGLASMDISDSAKLLSASLDENGAFSLERFSSDGLRTIHPLWSFHSLANMPACIVSVMENIKGDNGIYTPWEDQTAFALLEAIHALNDGIIDVACVIASDTPSHPVSLVELASSGFISYDEVVASAACALILERTDTCVAHSILKNIQLVRMNEAAKPFDPLAPIIGRTIAASPLLLTALAPILNLPCSLVGSAGSHFSFEVL